MGDAGALPAPLFILDFLPVASCLNGKVPVPDERTHTPVSVCTIISRGNSGRDRKTLGPKEMKLGSTFFQTSSNAIISYFQMFLFPS